MCGGGGGGGDPAKYQRQQDAQRRARITQGKQQLDQIFGELEGKSKRGNQAYLNMDEDAFRNEIADLLNTGVQNKTVQIAGQPLPMGYGYSRPSTTTTTTQKSFSTQAQKRLAELGLNPIQKPGRQVQVPSYIGGFRPTTKIVPGGTSFNLADYLNQYRGAKANPANFSMFDDPNKAPIWQQQQDAYIDYANPQLQDQYADAQAKLAFSLNRQGVGRSSIAGDNYGDLERDYGLREQDVREQARDFGNQARSNIATQKQSLLNMLSASADPGATATAARSAIDAARAQPAFSPLGPLFQNATSGLAAGYQGNQAFQNAKNYNDITYGGDPDRSTGKLVR